MKSVLSHCAFFFLVVLASVPVSAVEPLALYDNFNAPLIDPDRWFGSEFSFLGAEAVREIFGNRLHMRYRGYGDTGSNSDTMFDLFRLNFADADAVTAMKATVRVTNVESTGCAANGSPTQARASLNGFFFNTRTPTPGSAENDVLAAIRVRRLSDSTDPAGVLQVVAVVIHCGDANCFTGPFLGFINLGTVAVGDKVTLRIQWDPDNNRFIFQRGNQPEVRQASGGSD